MKDANYETNISLDLEKILIETFRDCYPLGINRILIVDAPNDIETAVIVAKSLLNEDTASKIELVESKYPIGSLWKYVDVAELPQYSSPNSVTTALDFVASIDPTMQPDDLPDTDFMRQFQNNEVKKYAFAIL